MQLLEFLDETILKTLPTMLRDIRGWDSLIINRRKPITYRVFRQIGLVRLCLHKFEYIDKDCGDEAFMHPHPWPGAFRVVAGGYQMVLGSTPDRTTNTPTGLSKLNMFAGSSYEIVDPLVWHSVTPLTKTVYTIMVNGEPWDSGFAHNNVRTTKGKDLDKMDRRALAEHLIQFQKELGYEKTRYIDKVCDVSPTGFCDYISNDKNQPVDVCIYCKQR